MIHLNRKNRSYSDNGGERADRNTDHDHPAFSRATFGLGAAGFITAATGAIGAGTALYGATRSGTGTAPPARNLGNELGTIANQVPTFAQLGYDNAARYNGALTNLNQDNFNNAMRGRFDANAYEAANPGFMERYGALQASGELQGWSPEQFALANSGNNQNALTYSGGFGTNLRDAFNSANPELKNYTAGLERTMENLNGRAPGPVNASGYNASGYNATGAYDTSAGSAAQANVGQMGRTDYGNNVQRPADIAGPQNARDVNAMMVNADTGYDRVNGNMGFDRVQAQQGDIGLASATQRMLTGGPSDIQRSLENQARGDLALGGALSQEGIRNSQQAAREAGAARGLINSNSTVAQEILNRDAASNARLNERRGFAAAVDQKGFGERQQGFANALGVSNAFQNYGAQNLAAQQSNQASRNQSNALNLQGQLGNQDARSRANALGLQGAIANQGASLSASQSNQSRDIAMNDARFKVANANQNAGLENNRLLLGYDTLNNSAFQSGADRIQQGDQFNANAINTRDQFNANLLQNNRQFNSGATNEAARFNSGATNDAARFNAGASNDINRFNADLSASNNRDAWSRAMGYGDFLGNQAIDPMKYYGLIQGNAPDYTNALLGYGSDLNSTNYNANAAANIARGNSNAALTSAGLGLIGNAASIYGNYAGSTAKKPGT